MALGNDSLAAARRRGEELKDRSRSSDKHIPSSSLRSAAASLREYSGFALSDHMLLSNSASVEKGYWMFRPRLSLYPRMNCRARAMSEIEHPQAGMNNNRHGRIVHFVALAIVIGGHVVLLLLFTKPRPMDAKTHSQSSGVLFLLELEPPPKPPSEEPRSVERSERMRSSPVRRPESASDQRSEPSTAIEAPAAVPEIDWHLEAQLSAEAMAPGWLEEQRRKCEEADGPPPPECRKRKYEFEWNAEPKTVGVAGLLPFVRLGKRCVIGLGFFGCALGKLPEPNGDLFKDMRDPDRPRSSVPDIPDAAGR